MGNGIAHVFALHGFSVSLIDVSEEALEKARKTIDKNLSRQVEKGIIDAAAKEAALASIRTFSSLEKGIRDQELVVEAVSENERIKSELFSGLDARCPPDTLLASNTSSISITKLAGYTKRPEKVIGMHFMNPVPVMPLVEVISGKETAVATRETIVALTRQLGKTPVVANDAPGFVSNRVLMPMINEAIYTLHEGVATVDAIDAVMTLGMAHPMGPLKLADLIGLDVCLSIMQVLHDGFDNPKYTPCPLLKELVEAGELGVKSGSGFYDYSNGVKQATVARQFTS